MRIALEARSLSAQGGGVQRYTRELIQHLLAGTSEHSYDVIVSSRQALGMVQGQALREHVLPLRHELLFYNWLWRQIPQLLRKLKPEVVHFTKADVPPRLPFPTVVTLYDVIPILFPEGQTLLKGLYWPWTLQRAAQISDHIVTISEASKKDIVHHLQVDPSKVTATPLAIDTTYFKPAQPPEIERVRSQYDLAKPYVLCVSTLEPRKNIPALIRAFRQVAADIPHQLVIAGKAGKGAKGFKRLATQGSGADRITFLEFVAPTDLPALYTGADLFVWPSIYEGWGFPAQEAMSCGVPVIVSNGGALPEVVGEAGEIVAFTNEKLTDRLDDGAFEERLGQTMHTVLTDSAKREQMRQQGFERVKQFSWEKVAQKTLEVYKKIAR